MCKCNEPRYVVILPNGVRVKFISREMAEKYARANGGRVERI